MQCMYYFAQVEAGSTNVRVGSTIFGARQYPPNHADTALPQPATNNPAAAPLSVGSGGDSSSQCVGKDATDNATAELKNLSLAS